MKHICQTFTFSLALLSFACCQNDKINSEQSNEIHIVGEATTRAVVSPIVGKESISNPDLYDNWENTEEIKLNGGSIVDAPWVYNPGNSINIPYDFRVDIKKENGWIMLGHTMEKQESAEPNYILFYNRKTGILKGFYYNRDPFNNNSFLWVLEAASPTSVFPSNTLAQGTLNYKSKFVTTSNVVEQSTFDFAQLNAGWNAFSFEFPYGTVDNDPTISIKGYSNQKSVITGSGNYSGEVLIPNAGGATGFASIMNVLGSVAGVVSTFVPQVSTVTAAISLAGTVLGNTSLYKSSSTTVRATSSGHFTLEASSFTSLGGAVYSINDIPLKKLNENNDLGLWTLSASPTYKCDKYTRAFVKPNGSYSVNIKMNIKEPILDLVTINPLIKNSIVSYKVISTQFFSGKSIGEYDRIKVANDIYHIKTTVSGRTDYLPTVEGPNNYCLRLPNETFCVNVTVEFIFNDDSSFISSRNFGVTLIQNDNSDFFGSYVEVN